MLRLGFINIAALLNDSSVTVFLQKSYCGEIQSKYFFINKRELEF